MQLQVDWLWPGEGAPFPAELTIEGDTVGEVRELSGSVAESRGERERLALPGLVNAHVHLDLTWPPGSSHLAEPFTDWLLSVRDRRRELGSAGLREVAARGVAMSLASGTTLLVDQDLLGVSPDALAGSAVRRVILKEIIAFEDDAAGRLPEIEAYLDASFDPGLEVRGLAPHAPYTVHPDLLEALISLAALRHRPWSMHIAEQPFEETLLREGTGEYAQWLTSLGVDLAGFPFPGQAPIEYLESRGWLDSGPLLVHGNYLSAEDVDRIASRGGVVVFCPRSHAWFGHPPHPLPALLEAGVEVALGTDGQLSNGELSVLEEMRAVRAAFPELEFPELGAERILRMGTVAGHVAVGECLGTGRLAPGEPADLVVLDLPRSDEPVLDRLLAGAGAVSEVIVAGRHVA